MSDQSDIWIREIESLMEEKSARILSIVLGITRGEAADKLLELDDHSSHIKNRPFSFIKFLAIGAVLDKQVHTASRIQSHRTGALSGVQFTDKFPTVNQWILRNPDKLAILRAGSHFIYVGCGIILDTDTRLPFHARVTHVIYLN